MAASAKQLLSRDVLSHRLKTLFRQEGTEVVFYVSRASTLEVLQKLGFDPNAVVPRRIRRVVVRWDPDKKGPQGRPAFAQLFGVRNNPADIHGKLQSIIGMNKQGQEQRAAEESTTATTMTAITNALKEHFFQLRGDGSCCPADNVSTVGDYMKHMGMTEYTVSNAELLFLDASRSTEGAKELRRDEDVERKALRRTLRAKLAGIKVLVAIFEEEASAVMKRLKNN